jgi:putative oxidoreductase
MAQIKFSAHSRQQARWKRITAWSLQILAALFFLGAGIAKLTGNEEMVAEFTRMGLGQWFRYLAGILDVTGALLLLQQRTVFVFSGGALLATMMFTCGLLHLFRMGGNPVPALVLLVITGTIAWLKRPQIQSRQEIFSSKLTD